MNIRPFFRGFIGIVAALLLAIPVHAEVNIALDLVNLVIVPQGTITSYAVGDRFDFNKMNGGFRFSVQNISQEAAKNVRVYWELRAEDAIYGSGDASVVCRDSFNADTIQPRGYVAESPTTVQCPKFETGGQYHVNYRVQSDSPDVYTGAKVDNWKTVYFDVYPLPKMKGLQILGTPEVSRHSNAVNNPTPVNSTFFVGDEFNNIRDMSFSRKVMTLAGSYIGGLYASDDDATATITTTIRDSAGKALCERSASGVQMPVRTEIVRFSDLGYKVKDLYRNCSAFPMAGVYTYELSVADVYGNTVVAHRDFVVGTTATAIVNQQPDIPQELVVQKKVETVVQNPIPATTPAQPVVTPTKSSGPLCQHPTDSDGDGVSDAIELQIGTNPYTSDTDGDGRSDADEILAGTNPFGTGAMLFVQSTKLKALMTVTNCGA